MPHILLPDQVFDKMSRWKNLRHEELPKSWALELEHGDHVMSVIAMLDKGSQKGKKKVVPKVEDMDQLAPSPHGSESQLQPNPFAADYVVPSQNPRPPSPRAIQLKTPARHFEGDRIDTIPHHSLPRTHVPPPPLAPYTPTTHPAPKRFRLSAVGPSFDDDLACFTILLAKPKLQSSSAHRPRPSTPSTSE